MMTHYLSFSKKTKPQITSWMRYMRISLSWNTLEIRRNNDFSHLQQCLQNVDVNGPHHRCFELIVSSSFNQPMAVERGRSHELVGSMVGAVYIHVLRTRVTYDYEIEKDPAHRKQLYKAPIHLMITYTLHNSSRLFYTTFSLLIFIATAMISTWIYNTLSDSACNNYRY